MGKVEKNREEQLSFFKSVRRNKDTGALVKTVLWIPKLFTKFGSFQIREVKKHLQNEIDCVRLRVSKLYRENKAKATQKARLHGFSISGATSCQEQRPAVMGNDSPPLTKAPMVIQPAIQPQHVARSAPTSK